MVAAPGRSGRRGRVGVPAERRAEVDVLVVGAGPTGLALAAQAHDHGARVRIVERRAAPFRPSRALIVHPRTLEVLRPLGVTEALLERGDVAPAVRLHLGSRQIDVRLGPFALPDTAFPHLLFVRQAVVEEVLSDALARRGLGIERGVELVAVEPGAEGARATLRAGTVTQRVRCRYVAGCDGANSTVRRGAGIAWRGGPYRQEVVLADAELAGVEPGAAHAVAGRRGLLFAFPIGERAPWRLLATRPSETGALHAGQAGDVPAGDVQALLVDAGLAGQVRALPWSTRVPLQHRLAAEYRRGPLFVVGDAAHVHSPAGGQGMNTGIQDATNLGWKLAFAARAEAGSDVADRLLDSYQAERRPVARRVLAMTHVLFWGEAGLGPAPTLLRSRLAPLAAPLLSATLRRPRLVAQGVRILSQLRVGYRRSDLSVDVGRESWSRLRAGDRLPDAPVLVDGHLTRLHDLLARPGVHILVDDTAEGPDPEALGPWVHMHHCASSGDRALVVRPDGYVGLQITSEGPAEIADWLARVGVPTTPPPWAA